MKTCAALTTHTFDKYQFDLPDGWKTTGRFPALTASKPGGVGTLLFFSFQPENTSLPANWSDFNGRVTGKTSFTKDDKTFSRTWAFIHADGTCLQIHYRCGAAHAAVEHKEIDQIVATLRQLGG